MRVAVAGWRALIADLQTMPPSKASERTTRKHALSGAVGPGATSPPVCSLTHAGSFAAGGAGGGEGGAPRSVPEDYEVPTAMSVWVAMQEEVWHLRAPVAAAVGDADPDATTAPLGSDDPRDRPLASQVESLLQDYLQDPLAAAAATEEREVAVVPVPGQHLRPGMIRKDGQKVRAECQTYIDGRATSHGCAHMAWGGGCPISAVVCVFAHGSCGESRESLPRQAPRS